MANDRVWEGIPGNCCDAANKPCGIDTAPRRFARFSVYADAFWASKNQAAPNRPPNLSVAARPPGRRNFTRDPYAGLSPARLDALREIAGIGAGNAATALAEILAGRIDMSVPELRIADIAGIPKALGGPEREVACVLLSVSGGFRGMLLFMLEKRLAHKLMGLLLGKRISGWEQLGPMDLSMLREVGNIAASAFAGSLAAMTGLALRVSPPEIAVDMAGAILNYPAAVFGSTGDRVLYVREDFGGGRRRVACHLLVIPQPDSLEAVLERLGAARD